MYCPNCGTESDERANFCQDCGHALSDAREEGTEDSKSAAIFTALQNLDGVDDKLLNRPEIGYLPTVLEDGELPDFVAAGAYGTGCLVATNRRIINVERSGSGSSFKCRSFAYSEVLSFEASTGIFSGTVEIHKSDGKTERVLVEKSRTRVFVGHVNAKIRPTEEMGEEQPEAESAEEQKTSDSQLERSDKSEEPTDTLAGYMSAKIQQMEAGGKDAPSPPLSSNVQEPEERGAVDTEDGKEKQAAPTFREAIPGILIIAAIPLVIFAFIKGVSFESIVLGAFIVVFALFVYFLPTIIATNRQHRNLAAIAVVNLFAGWTLIGWVGALAWAFVD